MNQKLSVFVHIRSPFAVGYSRKQEQKGKIAAKPQLEQKPAPECSTLDELVEINAHFSGFVDMICEICKCYRMNVTSAE